MAGYYDQLMQAGGGSVPPSQSDPWAWAQWARGQDPGTYNLGGGTLADNPDFVKTSAGMLRQAGLWKPEWDQWANYQEGTGESGGSGTYAGVPDLSSLAGYKLENTRGPGNSAFLQLLGPNGQQAGLEQYEQSGSWKSKDYIEMAAVAAAMFGGGMALNGGFASLGAGAPVGAGGVEAGTVAAAGGATTSPVIAGGTGWGGGALGAEGLSASMASLNGMALPAAPALTGAAGGAGVAAGAGAGINGYLTTGAVEGSTLGSSFTGAGGSAGAVGSGSSASWLQQLGQGASSFFGGGTGGGLRSAFDIVSGIYGLKLAGDARKASDPFGQYRGAYGNQLAQLEANPSTITGRPGWQAGMEAIQRNNAARGYAGSGNEMAVMSRYGGEFFNNEAQRLAGLAGAGAAPGAGQFPAANLTGQGLASIGYGLAPFLGGPR